MATKPLPAEEIYQPSTEEPLEFLLNSGILYDLNLPELPQGYGFSGGAARAIAQTALFGEQAWIRDIDVVAFEELSPDLSARDSIAEKYMQDDHAFGHGVLVVGLNDYFETRDFTVNEVTVVDGKIIISSRGYEDLRDKVIRPTDFETSYRQDSLSPRLAAKAYLMESVFRELYGKGRVEDFDPFDPDVFENESHGFDIAISLNKAFQYGPAVAVRFASRLEELGWLGDDMPSDPLSLAVALRGLTGFIFRGSRQAEVINYKEDVDLADIVWGIDFDESDTTRFQDINGRAKNRKTRRGKFRPSDEV